MGERQNQTLAMLRCFESGNHWVWGYPPNFVNTQLQLEKTMQPPALTHGIGFENRVPTSKLIYTKIDQKMRSTIGCFSLAKATKG